MIKNIYSNFSLYSHCVIKFPVSIQPCNNIHIVSWNSDKITEKQQQPKREKETKSWICDIPSVAENEHKHVAAGKMNEPPCLSYRKQIQTITYLISHSAPSTALPLANTSLIRRYRTSSPSLHKREIERYTLFLVQIRTW